VSDKITPVEADAFITDLAVLTQQHGMGIEQVTLIKLVPTMEWQYVAAKSDTTHWYLSGGKKRNDIAETPV